MSVVENATIPVIEVKEKFCPNKSYETKSSNTNLSYCAAAAPSRKCAWFDYYSLKYSSDSDTAWKWKWQVFAPLVFYSEH